MREVREETGIADVALGRCVWTGEYANVWLDGAPMHVSQRYYVARVGGAHTGPARTGPAPTGTAGSGASRAGTEIAVSFDGLEPVEAATTVGYRWFTLAEIAERQASESFRPPRLAELLSDLLSDELSADAEPIDVSLD
jgi:ADP-ribose pyrophosphatase YjhB (NUDIX family)